MRKNTGGRWMVRGVFEGEPRHTTRYSSTPLKITVKPWRFGLSCVPIPNSQKKIIPYAQQRARREVLWWFFSYCSRAKKAQGFRRVEGEGFPSAQ